MYAQPFSLFRRHPACRVSTALIVLSTFTWFLVHPTVLAAQPLMRRTVRTTPLAPGTVADLTTTLALLETALTQMQLPDVSRTLSSERAGISNSSVPPSTVTPHESMSAPASFQLLCQRLTTQLTQLWQQMDAMGQHLQTPHMAEVLRQRHRDAMAQMTTALGALQRHLDTVEAATSATARATAATQALAYLHAGHPRRARPQIDPHHLPFRVPNSNVRPPREHAQEFHTSLESSNPIVLASAALLPGLLAPAVTVNSPLRQQTSPRLKTSNLLTKSVP
jgi:hypothetical protein